MEARGEPLVRSTARAPRHERKERFFCTELPNKSGLEQIIPGDDTLPKFN